MGKSRRQRVMERAKGRCEYCRIPQEYDVLPFQVDHILAQKHEGATTLANLACACLPCNSYQGPNIAGVDPVDGAIVRLFNPRADIWGEHFSWHGPELVGLTPIARATIAVLRINAKERVELRRLLMKAGLYRERS